MIHDKNLTAVLKAYVHGSEHPDLQVYRRGIASKSDYSVWLWRMKHFCDLGGFYGKSLLEVGAGFGWDAVGLALTGNNRVTASDILPSMIDGMTQCLEAMSATGNPLPVKPLLGDICEVDLPDGSFDGIFSTEAIEHVHDLGLMFDNCHRLLKRGGVAVIVNDSNQFNEASRRHSWDDWQARDESWEHVDWLKSEVRPIEHADARPYGVMREEMIRQFAPSLNDDSVAALREATAGMIRPEIEAAVTDYKAFGKLPKRDPFSWCRNPETGEYSERLLNPFELADMLKARGFKVQLRHLFRKMPYRLFNRSPRIGNRMLFRLRPEFVLVARKVLGRRPFRRGESNALVGPLPHNASKSPPRLLMLIAFCSGRWGWPESMLN